MTSDWRWRVFMARLDPAVGSEQAGTRPVLVVSEEEFNQNTTRVTILPLTTRKRGRKLYPSEVLVAQGTAGLTADSIILVHQVRTISKQRLVRTLGALEHSPLRRQIVEELVEHFDLSSSEGLSLS